METYVARATTGRFARGGWQAAALSLGAARGVSRPQGAASDIGSYESVGTGASVTPDGGHDLRKVPSNGTEGTVETVLFNLALAGTDGAASTTRSTGNGRR